MKNPPDARLWVGYKVREVAGWKWSSYGYYATSDNVLLEIDVAATE